MIARELGITPEAVVAAARELPAAQLRWRHTPALGGLRVVRGVFAEVRVILPVNG